MCKVFTLLPHVTAMDELKTEDPQMHHYMVENGFSLQRGAQLHPALSPKTMYVTGDFGDGNDWMNFSLFRAIYCRHYAT